MIKGKEGIALIMAIFFIVALSILLTAVLMLNNQEIRATQLQLDSNKAFYYAEAGVEYGVAQVLNKQISPSPNQPVDLTNNYKISIRQSSGDSNIDKSVITLTVESPSYLDYKFTCEVRYNTARRKVTKEILLYTGIWDKAMASNGDINFGEIHSGGGIVIEGDIHSNGYIECKSTSNLTITGKAYYAGDPQKAPNDLLPGAISSPSLSFPSTNFNYYYSIANYIYNTEDDFLNAFKAGKISSPGVVYISGDLHIVKLQGLTLTGLTIVVNGDIHINNQVDMTIDGGSSMVTFIAQNMKFDNDAKGNFNFKNCIIYTINNVDFTNMKGNVTVDNGAIYAQQGYINLNNIKNTFTVERKNWKAEDLFIFDLYKTCLLYTSPSPRD